MLTLLIMWYFSFKMEKLVQLFWTYRKKLKVYENVQSLHNSNKNESYSIHNWFICNRVSMCEKVPVGRWILILTVSEYIASIPQAANRISCCTQSSLNGKIFFMSECNDLMHVTYICCLANLPYMKMLLLERIYCKV